MALLVVELLLVLVSSQFVTINGVVLCLPVMSRRQGSMSDERYRAFASDHQLNLIDRGLRGRAVAKDRKNRNEVHSEECVNL